MKNEKELLKLVNERDSLLNQLRITDYVVIKINEAQINGEDVTSLKEHYKDVLVERGQVRTQVRELEAKIQNLLLEEQPK